ncbi:MAG: response regulator transcription factor [Polaromonas sp.]|uniref:response regulator transcription factor n=1 Tax=Polaromonas sp. TaxID=1869339 RepID=UPI0027354A39|nr:response regulator transcription factor [Polaromonas sp.]MDP2820350.1 response regulator transcription factor [Polaromonas sp.]
MNLLIVEDDPRVADFLQRGLRAEGYRVSLASDGQQALAVARAEAFSIVLLDVMLPKMSGIEVCQQLRADRNPVPILMLTAMGTVQDRVTGLRCGADDYLIKPFAFDELLARIESLMRRPAEIHPRHAAIAQLKVGALVFNREKMRVNRDSQDISLTAKELALLELLMSAPGRLFSRERILSNVWGSHEDPLTNVVDVYIRRLRAKIDEQGVPSLIQTVRGLGYKIQEAA